jgi:2,3-bisphosphoglycerate-dependent phosphoglycerate mutase
LILVRHGQSTWNVENLFTGWHDVDLSDLGRIEAKSAGVEIKKAGIVPDIAFTSVLKRADPHAVDRARRDGSHVAAGGAQLAPERAPLRRAAGPRQGADRGETRRGAGEDLAPQLRHPAAAAGRRRQASSASRRRYAKIDPRVLPASESLKDTLARVLPFWNDRIVRGAQGRQERAGGAHGNSLRAVVKMLDNVSEADITELNIPTGVPLVYELDDELKPLKSGYLGDPRPSRRGRSRQEADEEEEVASRTAVVRGTCFAAQPS